MDGSQVKACFRWISKINKNLHDVTYKKWTQAGKEAGLIGQLVIVIAMRMYQEATKDFHIYYFEYLKKVNKFLSWHRFEVIIDPHFKLQ